MAFSYSGDPSTSSRDQVRFLVGDTVAPPTPQPALVVVLQDAEIDWLLSANGNPYYAAVEAANALAAGYARQVDNQVGQLKVTASQRYAHYTALAARLRRRAGASVLPYAGGISQSDKDKATDNPDLVPPLFNRTQFDLPAANLPTQPLSPLDTSEP